MNKILIYFNACNPPPSKGYKVHFRVKGSTGAYTPAGNYFKSPAGFVDLDNPEGTEYEGFIRSDCGKSYGTPISWETQAESGSAGGIEGNAYLVRLGDIIQGDSICSEPAVIVYLDILIRPGVLNSPYLHEDLNAYYDSNMTIPVTGFTFIVDTLNGRIFNIDYLTGRIGSATIYNC
jgi:hypothetical protein